MNLQEIEAVARALYEIQEEARDWHRTSEHRRAKFREEARAAIAVLDQHDRQARAFRSVQPLSPHGAAFDLDARVMATEKRRLH
ncbi:hypothetical protein AA309_25155 [Microvirga vignae]|uniref:Uncharacterized protein n=1 Tax=Microvirga vignae TaxID=1225564 RepID=A0A0H1R6U4_9HYPH|nr:hypothetical protein AA309_25155 [Microvirga vignae]